MTFVYIARHIPRVSLLDDIYIFVCHLTMPNVCIADRLFDMWINNAARQSTDMLMKNRYIIREREERVTDGYTLTLLIVILFYNVINVKYRFTRAWFEV